MDFYSSQLSDGQEGVILRNINSEYERKRSKNLLKFKPVDDDEGVIIAVHEGKGNWANTTKTATLKWKDIEFDPVFLGTVEELKDILIDKESYIGRLVKFKFNGLTGLGVPNFARIDLKN
jgi:DNA ligase 1